VATTKFMCMSDRVIAGRYRLARVLGRGGMGRVWLAHDELLDRDVAIKEILASIDQEASRRAMREARAAAQLKHPNIVTVYDVVNYDEQPWIVMELVEGQSLAEAGPLPEERIAEIGLAMLGALNLAHQRGILHRDVKPANILLDGDRVVLTDFGIAAISGDTALTATGRLIGSPEYIAPERINGDEATAAADLWALGITLYSALTGRSPFQRSDIQTTYAAVLASDPVRPPQATRIWPAIEGLLVKNPARRLTIDGTIGLLARPRHARRFPVRKLAIIAVLVVLIIATTVIVLKQPPTTTNAATPPSTTTTTTSATTSTSTTIAAPPPPSGYTVRTSSLGFTVAVPGEWVGSSIGYSNDAKSGPSLELEISRTEPTSPVQAYPYLWDIVQAHTDDPGYQQIKLGQISPLNGTVSAAEWECTMARPKYPLWGYEHDYLRVIVGGPYQRVYTLAFRVRANTPQQLATAWQGAQGTLDVTMATFRITA
jgi:serine/threonine protein kinase